MEENNKYIRFDWAMKHMLRDNANFDILEGFISVLTGEDMKIDEILESEANQDTESDKFNRVDIKAKNSQGHIIIVEVQLSRKVHYLERVVLGVGNSITDRRFLGNNYGKVDKVYSISILYFDFGPGKDYMYRGQTVFRGLHTGDEFTLTDQERGRLGIGVPEVVLPEYCLVRVNNFDKIPETPLEEWMEYLKTGRIKEGTSTPGLREGKEKLRVMMMNERDKQAYWRHMDNIMVQNDAIDTAYDEGMEKGFKEGLKSGFKEGLEKALKEIKEKGNEEGPESVRLGVVLNMIAQGFDDSVIAQIVSWPKAEVASVRAAMP